MPIKEAVSLTDSIFSRVLQMDSIPYGLAFCTFQGDIIIELHCHLHIISNTTCKASFLWHNINVLCSSDFTDSLLKQFLSLNVSEPVEQSWKGFSIDISILKPEDCQRLQINENHIEKYSNQCALPLLCIILVGMRVGCSSEEKWRNHSRQNKRERQ